MKLLTLACLGLALATSVAAEAATPEAAAVPAPNYDFGAWEPGTSPVEIGKRVSERFLPTAFLQGGTRHPYIIYPEVCTWYGALTFAQAAGDADLRTRLVRRFDPLLKPENQSLIPPANHVDNCVFGGVPLEIYLQTRQIAYRTLGLQIADAQWDNPTPDGYTSQTRLWIDDMFMITSVQVQAYRVTGDSRYLDRTAKEMAYYLDQLQQPNGLFFHAPDAPYFWGRGNGWMAAGMAELLRSLPTSHPLHARIFKSYRQMMETLLAHQAPDGMWRQLVDKPDSWPETSCTGMFTFAFVTGVKNGWLDAERFGPAARKGWLALISYLTPEADVREVCVGTNKRADIAHYYERPRKTGDLHGQAPILWSATAFLR